MTEQEVIDLMQSSKSLDEWNNNCLLVRARLGGYPPYWYRTIILSGLQERVFLACNADKELHIFIRNTG